MSQPLSESTADLKSNNTWRRLSPIAIVFFILRFSVRFVKDGLINMAPALAVFITQVDDKSFWGSIAAVVFVFAVIIYSILYYRTFKFRVQKDKLLLTKGVLKKETTTLQFNKVQNVNLSTPFYFAPFKLVNCIFDSAGSSAKEISFPGVDVQYAESLRNDILVFKAQQSTASNSNELDLASDVDTDHQSSTETVSKPRLSLSLIEIAKFGLSSNMTFLLLAFLAPFMETIVDYAKHSIIPSITAALSSFGTSSESAASIAVAIFVVAVILSALLLSVIAAIIQFYNYQLFITTERFQRIAGLFDRHQITMTKHRIQAVSIKQNWVFKLFKRVTIQFHQMAVIGNNSAKNKTNLSIPTLPPSSSPEIMREAFPELAVDNFAFRRIHKRFWSRTFIFTWLIPLFLVGSLMINVNIGFALLYFFIPVGFVLSYLRWRRYGLWYNRHFAAFKSGLVGHTITIFPIYKVQKATMKSSPAMRKARLATVELQLAYGKKTIPYLPLATAQEFVNLVLYEIESNQKHWLNN